MNTLRYTILSLSLIVLSIALLISSKGVSQSIYNLSQPIERGTITDINGNVLASSGIRRDVSVWPSVLNNPVEIANALSPIVNLERDTILNIMYSHQDVYDYPVKIKKGLNQNTFNEILHLSNLYPGIEPQEVYSRVYPYHQNACHIIGYVGSITQDDINVGNYLDYDISDEVGKSGLEKYFESEFHQGINITLTLDLSLQQKAETVLGSNPGSIVVLDAANGDILAMVSKPDYDPNWFVHPVNNQAVSNLLSNKNTPLINRAISGTYPLGSAFKVITALAALESGAVDQEDVFHCNGSFQPYAGSRVFHCHQLSGHGSVNMISAIQQSCNVYFYNIGLAAGEINICEIARMFGLGQTTGVPLAGERSGIVPDMIWQQENNYDWYTGHTVILSIGQGPLLVTPLQVAYLYLAIANGGKLYHPRLIKSVDFGNEIKETPIRIRRNIDVSSNSLSIVRQGLEKVTQRGGTAYSAFANASYQSAGKTGTAEYYKTINGVQSLRKHTWYIGYYPVDNPEILVVVFVEDGESGELTSAPLARSIMDYYYTHH